MSFWDLSEISFPHKIITETRAPLLEFTVPEDFGGGRYEFRFLMPEYWIEVLALVCFQLIVAAMTGALVYKVIVEPKAYETPTALYWGYGVLIPLWILWPSFLIQTLGIQNFIFRFILGGVTPTLSLMRLLEAIHGCCPPHVTRSFYDYVLYFASVLVFSRDPKTGDLIPAPMSKTMKHLGHFVVYLFITGALQSFLTSAKDLNVFGPEIADDGWLAMERLTTWYYYVNAFLQGALFQMYLLGYCEGLTFFWHLVSGYQTNIIMRNPLFASTSPSDFWGRRWNLLVQGALKGGAFKPVRKYFSKPLAVLSCFLASGLIHELLVINIFMGFSDGFTENCEVTNCYPIRYGGAMVFFLWQALLVSIEPWASQLSVVKFLAKTLPLPARTMLILLLGIPTSHFFTEPYVRSHFFHHGQLGLPMLTRADG